MLHLPPSVSVSKFSGGYKPVSEYTDLGDTDTNDAQNVRYGPDGDLQKRAGGLRLLPSRLTTSTAPTVGRPITGHYYFEKLNQSASFHIVGAGDSLYSYSSATATAIATALTDNSNTFWNLVQIQDPRSASDDIAVATNGVDAIKVWNGSATAVNLSSFTSASGVPICKYLLNHKERLYALNIVDATDADSPVKVARSGFGADGNPDPHRFRESFYVGGSSKSGEIRGGRVLNDQIVIYTRHSIWKYNPGSGDLGDLQEMQQSVGLLAPSSLVDCGNFHMFLSERGIFAFDGVNLVHLSEKVDEEFFSNSTLSQLQHAKAVFNKRDNQYTIYFAMTGSSRNDRGLTYDLRLKQWQPPITGRRVSVISTFNDANKLERTIYGDYVGYLYQDGTGLNDGLSTGFNGSVTAATFSTLTDTAAAFTTSNDGLSGLIVRIYAGTGSGQERVIASNTATELTLETDWTTVPDTTSFYTIGGIDAAWRSKDYEFGNQDLLKLFRHIYARVREEGNFNLTLHYIVDFKALAQATSKDIRLLDSGFAWDLGRWDQARWGAKSTIRRKISLRATQNQSLNGTHLALRFANGRANESFRISGYDIELKGIGKR